MKKVTLALLLLCALTCARAQTVAQAQTSWHDTTRDVFIDNELDRSAQVLASDSPQRLAVISSKLDRAIVLDTAAGSVSAMPKEAFRLGADRTSATSDAALPAKAIGKFTRIDGPVYSFAVDGKPVLIRPHPGRVGEMSYTELWETVPVWRAEMEAYEPDASVTAAIKRAEEPATVTLLFGTWCGDSKYYIPRVIKALQAAGNDKIKVRLVGVDSQFREPADTVQPRHLTNVPTMIVERGGREVARVVETPFTGSFEEDLSSILGGKTLGNHPGRWDRGPKVAAGTYVYRDRDGNEVGKEEWELFTTAEGGYLLRSRATVGVQTTDVFHRVGPKRNPTFVEITKQQGDERVRTRINIDRTTMTARTRGDVSGVITQTLEVPEQFFVSSPAAAAQGWAGDQKRLAAYFAPQEFYKTSGAVAAVEQESKGDETVRTPAGEFRARHVVRRAGKESSEWWLHPQLAVPVRGLAGGVEYVLTSLSLPPAAK